MLAGGSGHMWSGASPFKGLLCSSADITVAWLMHTDSHLGNKWVQIRDTLVFTFYFSLYVIVVCRFTFKIGNPLESESVLFTK